ncbi:hypothetical protein AB0D78_46300 [Streptomyces avermitilis]|uniref:hypothetical protein n=1 Tax=Streptomyces avermitilis TaxID=33903 RepID=UPI0033C1333D
MNNAKRYAVVAGSVLAIIAIVVVWFTGDMNAAGQVASVVAGCAAVITLARELLRRGQPAVTVAQQTGKTSARSGGDANSGITGPADSLSGEFRAERTGDAEGDGGTANSGIRLS